MVAENGKRDADGPSGAPSPGHDQSQGEGMTNGIPDALQQGQATATPHSEREDSETAAGRNGERDSDDD